MLILSLGLLTVGCDLFGSDPVDDPPGTNGDPNNGGENNNNPPPTTNPYLDLISELLNSLSDLESMEDYIRAISYILHHIHIENVMDSAEEFIADEYATFIVDNFDTGLRMLDFVADILPVLPKIDIILGYLETLDSLPFFDIDSTLAQVGIIKDGDTYSFSHQSVNYSVTILVESTYLLSFGDTTVELEYISENNIKVDYEDVLYELFFDEPNQSLRFNGIDMTDAEHPSTVALFESVIFNGNLAMQFFDKDSQTLAQLKTEIELLEATISLQEDIDELPYSLLNGIPSEFATKGELYFINSGLLDAFL